MVLVMPCFFIVFLVSLSTTLCTLIESGFSWQGYYRNVFIIVGSLLHILENMNSSKNLVIYYNMSCHYRTLLYSMCLWRTESLFFNQHYVSRCICYLRKLSHFHFLLEETMLPCEAIINKEIKSNKRMHRENLYSLQRMHKNYEDFFRFSSSCHILLYIYETLIARYKWLGTNRRL